MKKIASIIIIMLLCVCSTSANSSWNKHVEFSSTDTYKLAMNEIEEQRLCKQVWAKENGDLLISWTTGDADHLEVNSLLSMISSGDEQAFRIGLKFRKCFGGGDLGDYLRASGLFFEKKPKEFFIWVKKEGVSDEGLRSMMAMLPLEYTDNEDRKINALKERIALLLSIRGTANSTIIEKSLSYLKEYLAEYHNLVIE